MNKVLILGAGLVAKPMAEYLLEKGFKISMASRDKTKSEKIIAGHPGGKAIEWSMNEPDVLYKLIGEYDLVVSLLPYRFHPDVARMCIEHKKPLVTTSYVQPAMQELHKQAEEAGIILLNEIGVDPGIDHMSAMRIIDAVHDKGGEIEEFYSLCGALPAPEAADNPLGYKFSWSPLGVILASRNDARFIKKGEEVYVKPENLFKERFSVNIPEAGNLEVYPNRNSVSYIDIYGIPETKTMFRGTFRFPGWCETLDLMKSLNLLDEEERDYSGVSWIQFIGERAGIKEGDVREEIMSKYGLKSDDASIKAFEWLGFFNETPMEKKVCSPLDIISEVMFSKMMLEEKERDMVVMQHSFLVKNADGSREVIKSGMIDYGTPETNTAIARTVSLPAAIAVKLILEGKINIKGVWRPTIPEIYNPVLDELEEIDIVMNEEFGLPVSELI